MTESIGPMYVFRTLAQRRHLHRKHIQAVIEVCPKLLIFHHLRQVAIRRRDQPRIRWERVRTAQTVLLRSLTAARVPA